MRQSVILPSKFEAVFLNEAEKSYLIKPLPNPADELYPKKELEKAEQYYKKILDKQEDERQKVFRMLLLFDEIILTDLVEVYDYTKLIETGLFELFFIEDMCKYDPIHQEGHIEYAKYLKPAILPVFEKEVKRLFREGKAVGGLSGFISDLYNYILLGERLSPRHLKFITMNKKAFDLRNKNYYEKMRREYINPPDVIMEKQRFFTEIQTSLNALYEKLCWELMISSDKDAAIMDCEFLLSNIGCDSYSEDVTQGMEAYNILRVECGKILGTLPKVDNMQEVLRLKEKRHHDIHNLRQELSRLEYEIREGNSLHAAEKAAADVSKASKSLSHGNVVSKVTKWTNFFSIPVTAAALFLERPQISIGAGALSVIGKTASFIETTIKDRNRWFEIVI